MSHENIGKSDEWYTPKYIFDALDCQFDLDVAAPEDLTHIYVPSYQFIKSDSINKNWRGFIWMNPPYGNMQVKNQWLEKFFKHGNGIALMPDRTSAPWWQKSASKADAMLFVDGKIKFIKPNGSLGEQPSNGTTLFGIGEQAVKALLNAENNGLGRVFFNSSTLSEQSLIKLDAEINEEER